VTITRFDSRVEDGAVRLEWETYADERIERLELLRAVGDGDLSTMDAAIAASATSYLDRSVEPGVRYDYQLVAHGAEGWTAVSPRVSATVPAAGLALRQNTPNPFGGATDVSFTLPQRGTVRLSVYDVAGHHVTTLFAGEQGAGDHTVSWNGTDDAGQRVGAGIYFCRVESGTKTLTRKMVLVR
jgi:hypothetical protein